MATTKTPTRRTSTKAKADEATAPVVETKATETKKEESGTLPFEMVVVGVDQLEVNKLNPRFDYGDDLSESIMNNGIKIPFRVKRTGKQTAEGKDIFEIKDGHRRFSNIKTLGKKVAGIQILCQVQPEGYPEKQEIYDLIATSDGKNLNLLEQGEVFRRAREAGDTDAEIARQAGKSQTHIADCLLLIDKASDKLIKDIKAKKISPTTVLDMLKAQSTEETEKDVEAAKQVAGEKKVTSKHISEATGKSKANKINSSSGKATKVIEDKKEAPKGEENAKSDPAPKTDYLAKLKTLQVTLSEASDGRNEQNFDMLGKIIDWLEGKIKANDLAASFYDSED